MSNIGLSTNTFRVTGRYLEMLIDFIVKTKVNHEISDVKKDQLLDFITNIRDKDNTQLHFQLLASIIDRELRNHHNKRDVFFNAVLRDIEERNIDDLLPKIEFLVEALDTENSEALSKIKGD